MKKESAALVFAVVATVLSLCAGFWINFKLTPREPEERSVFVVRCEDVEWVSYPGSSAIKYQLPHRQEVVSGVSFRDGKLFYRALPPGLSTEDGKACKNATLSIRKQRREKAEGYNWVLVEDPPDSE